MRLNRLRELREDRNMSQQALADLVNTSQQNIYKYENGITEPDIQMLKLLADVFHTSIDYIVEYYDSYYRQITSALLVQDKDSMVDVPVPEGSNHISGDKLHLLISYEKCRQPIREHILYIMEELAKIR